MISKLKFSVFMAMASLWGLFFPCLSYGWTENTKLIASDGAASDNFGYSASISGNYAIIGSYNDDDRGSNSGSAYVFVRGDTGWILQTKLTASDGAAGDYFGYSVSISGDYAIVGAYNDGDRGSGSGSAYIFARNDDGWTLQTKLTASDGAADDYFGYSVSIFGNHAIVGSYRDDDRGTNSGSAYIFVRDGVTWTEQSKLTASDGAGSDRFGYSVSISENYAIVGSYLDDDNGTSSGSAYIFAMEEERWTEQPKLTASDGDGDDRFGYSVSISGDYAVVGAYNDEAHGSGSGSCYVFARGDVGWVQQAKLTAGDGAAGDYFGYSVAISENYVVAGAYGDDDRGSNSGSVYVFAREDVGWSQQAKLTAGDGTRNDRFGYSVAIFGYSSIAGAYNDGSGSAYIYKHNIPPSANAGSDQLNIYEGATITLSGSCLDVNPDDTLTGHWTQISGTSCGDINEDAGISEATCAAPDVSENEVLIFQLGCFDGTDTTTDTTEMEINAKPTAFPQAIATREDTSLDITLTGSDPNSEELLFSVVTEPLHGSLTGVLPNLTYHPAPNYNGDDAFTFRVADEASQNSEIASITISVTSENDPPIISEESDELIVTCPAVGNCQLPSWDILDPDGDAVSSEWRQIGGSGLHFTEDNWINLINFQMPRNNYFVQLVVDDGVAETTSSPVTISIPNHEPSLQSIAILEDTTLENNTYRLNSFAGIIHLNALLIDYDNDNLSYDWNLVYGEGGFLTTSGGNATLHLRKVGKAVINMTVKDGFGGSSEKQINIFQPLPDFTPEIEINSYNISDNFISELRGQILSPVMPIVVINNVTADITLSESLLPKSVTKELSSSLFETYSFTAKNILLENGSSLNIKVLTDVDHVNTILVDRLFALDTANDGYAGENEGNDNTGDNDGGTNAYGTQETGPGCHVCVNNTKGHNSWLLIFLLLPVLLVCGFSRAFFAGAFHCGIKTNKRL